MDIKYNLKVFHSIFNNFKNVKFQLGTTFDENDLQELNFNELKVGGIVALVTNEDGEFSCADGTIIKDIKKNVIYLEDGKCFDSNGNDISFKE